MTLYRKGFLLNLPGVKRYSASGASSHIYLNWTPMGLEQGEQMTYSGIKQDDGLKGSAFPESLKGNCFGIGGYVQGSVRVYEAGIPKGNMGKESKGLRLII